MTKINKTVKMIITKRLGKPLTTYNHRSQVYQVKKMILIQIIPEKVEERYSNATNTEKTNGQTADEAISVGRVKRLKDNTHKEDKH